MALGSFCALAIGAVATLGVTTLPAHHASNDEPNIVAIAAGNENFETLVAALTAAELVDDIEGATGITVLAPTDAAFAELDQDALEATIRRSPTGRLADILKFHVIPETLTAAELANRRFVTTLDGQRLEIAAQDGITLNGSRIRAADIRASNGIVHAIDAVLIPARLNVAETAADVGTFETLLAAANAAGLADILAGDGPLTVFAPTDEAFADLGGETIASLLKPENRDTLAEILSYHAVIGARVYSEQLVSGAPVRTATGESIEPGVQDGEVFVNDARVISANVDASNGVVHVIDRVLMPPSLSTGAGTKPAEGRVGRAASVEDVFTIAIERGVPLFNDHQRAACAAVYEVAILAVLALEDGLSDDQRRTLSGTIDLAARTADDTERAWVYRRGIDSVLRSRAAVMRTSDRAMETSSDDQAH